MTDPIDNKRTNRRELFGSCVALLRGAAVATVATGGVWLIRRDAASPPDLPGHSTCPPDGLCRRCPAVRHCGRPEAESYRVASAKGGPPAEGYRVAQPPPAEGYREGHDG